ncbi:monooxygenase [Aspergillus avenaceus]|uniref:Monooxygenase n=1 Tax=Aspergillus avenaceus TaxID=36643 RepID=A0A5N6TUI3_ASPAV|nr:monooxygenase [Aspergillus avenaceus]
MGSTAIGNVDLVIVGGGPTGLTSAVLARSLGLSVYIIDAKDGPLEVGRADALNARTQQYLEVSGTLHSLLPQGITCNTSSTFEGGKFTSRQSQWWTSLAHTHRPNFLMLGQSRVEEALRQQLDISIDYGSHVVAIAETSEHVTVTTNRDKVIRAKYAIASDGARSFVRRTLDIPFVGTKPEMVWAVLDTFLETDFPVCSEIISLQVDGQSRVAWIPRERGMARFYVLLDGEITQEKTEESIRAHMQPYKVSFLKTEWFSTFEIKERVAETFISNSAEGRILLAGDAAHVHAVNGGQGLNTGIADAFAMIWRLALVVKGHGSQDLLRTYDTERREVAIGVIDVAAKLVRTTVKTALEYVDVIERNAGYITGMGVSYPPGSRLVRESKHGDFIAGQRCPDLHVRNLSEGKDNTQLERLYSIFKYGRFKIFIIGGKANVSSEVTQRFSDVAEFWHVHNIPCAIGSGLPEYFAEWVQGDEDTVVVIRPDLYVGYAGAEWQDYLDGVFDSGKIQSL